MKQQDPSGTQSKLNVRMYEEACSDAMKSKAARHRRRNVQRQKLGLRLTQPLPDDASEYTSSDSTASSIAPDSADESESSDEAREFNEIEQGSVGRLPAPRAIKQTTFKGIPPINKNPRASPPRRLSATSLSTGRLPAGDLGRSTAGTTYQGTARKPNAASKTTPRPLPAAALKTVQTATATATITSSSSTVPSSAILANKFKLKAVRTGSATSSRLPRPQAGVPAYKVRKKRTNLKESMVDSTREPKLFKYMKRVNQARKRGIELNEAAPLDMSAIPANFLITGDQPRRVQSLDVPAGVPATNTEQNRRNTEMVQTGPAILSASGTKKPRKGLSVQFDDSTTKVNFFTEPDFDEPTFIYEPMSIDNTLDPIGHDDSTANTATKKPRRLSLSQYQERGGTQTVARIVTFGRDSRETRALFKGITRIDQPWRTHFMAKDHLIFETICAAADFFSQPLYRPENRLSYGILEFRRDFAASEAIAARLQKTATAFYLARDEYSILVYPNGYEAWKPLTDPTSPGLSEGLLRYVIFQTTPLRLALYPPLPTTATKRDGVGATAASVCDAVMKQIFDESLSAAIKDQNTFVLVYYPVDEHLFQVLSLWLRLMRPQCQIYASRIKGSWKSFRKSATEPATIIFHESVVAGIRKIPLLWKMLQQRTHEFWSLSACGNPKRLWPTTDGRVSDHPPSLIPVQLTVTRIFPYGRAILITPSFAVSQPRELCRALERFKARAMFEPIVLVACANFPEYLRALYSDKARERDAAMLARGDSHIPIERPEFESMDMIRDRIGACELAGAIADSRRIFRLGGVPEDIAKTVWADDVMAADDEQSLVNWFAAWSTMRLTSYREFYVMGTDARDKKWSHRTVKVPNYSAGTVGNPDVLYTREARKQQDAASLLSPQAPPRTAMSTVFNCRDLPHEIREWALYFLAHGPANSWSRLYAEPVSWADTDMADGFGDPLCKYATFKNWFYYMHRYNQSSNTLIGFFYTVDTDWDRTKQSSDAPRHPWVAIYRPADPHKNKDNYTRMELLIWDPAVEGRLPTHPGPMSKLLPMQRRLIDYVGEEAPKRFEKHYLDRVWIGGFPLPPVPEPPYPLDVTRQAIENFVLDGNTWLNAWATKLVGVGWRQLNYDAYKAQSATGPGGSYAEKAHKEPETFIKAASDAGRPVRMIFHPPPGDDQVSTRCTNDLYNAALDARRARPECTSFHYRFRPTTQWYQELVEEGREYNHIRVGSWDELMNDCLPKRSS